MIQTMGFARIYLADAAGCYQGQVGLACVAALIMLDFRGSVPLYHVFKPFLKRLFLLPVQKA